jgi:hypothetical protein
VTLRAAANPANIQFEIFKNPSSAAAYLRAAFLLGLNH